MMFHDWCKLLAAFAVCMTAWLGIAWCFLQMFPVKGRCELCRQIRPGRDLRVMINGALVCTHCALVRAARMGGK